MPFLLCFLIIGPILIRHKAIQLAAYAKHMLKYQDSQFGRHPLFHHYVFNRIMREQGFSTTHFLYNQSIENNLSLDKLSNLYQKIALYNNIQEYELIPTFIPTPPLNILDLTLRALYNRYS